MTQEEQAQIEGNATLDALRQQRNEALDRAAALFAKSMSLARQLDEAQNELAKLKSDGKPDLEVVK